jgi:hypothetical protein
LQINIFSDLIALQLGIIHPTIAEAMASNIPKSIDSALESLTCEESRICRRKFRKISRSGNRKVFRNAHHKRNVVMNIIRSKAWKALKEHGQDFIHDNDE